MVNLLFFHGGPGLNSNPEKNILRPKLEINQNIAINWWNEPSTLRGDKDISFQSQIKSAKEFLSKNLKTDHQNIIISHSFSFQVLVYCLKEFEDEINQIIFISPCTSLQSLDLNLADIAIKGLIKSDPKKAQKIRELKINQKNEFDSERQQLLEFVFQYPDLFEHYWNNARIMTDYFNFLIGDYAFDLNSFWDVRKTTPMILPKQTFWPRTKIIYGSHDTITPKTEHLPICKSMFPNSEIFQIEQSGHFVHMENIEKLKEIILHQSQLFFTENKSSKISKKASLTAPY